MTPTLRRFALLSLSLFLLAASSEAAKRIHLEDLLEDIPIQARVRHTTVIVLPPSENILDFVAGDTETWAVTGSANVAYLKPGEKDSTTNIVLVCQSGNIYSFKVSEDEEAEPDLVVYIDYARAMVEEETPGGGKPVLHEPKYVSRMDVAVYQEAAQQAEENARAAWKRAEQQMQSAIDRFRSTYPTLIRFEYRLDKKASNAPFEIAGMWHDGRFTYVRSHAAEAPALYENRDGKPSLVNYELQPDGLYIINRVVEDGHFQIGKHRAKWWRERQPPQPDPQLVRGRISLATPKAAAAPNPSADSEPSAASKVTDETPQPATELDQ